VLPEGWTQQVNSAKTDYEYKHIDGTLQADKPGKPEGVIAIASALPDMGAMSTVIVNTFPLPIQDIKSKAALDFSGKGLKVEDAIIIAALIPSNVSHKQYISPPVITNISICDKGTLTHLDISMNTLTRGALKAGCDGTRDFHYETDMTGMNTLLVLTFPLIPYIFLCRHDRYCQCHPRYGGYIVSEFGKEHDPSGGCQAPLCCHQRTQNPDSAGHQQQRDWCLFEGQ
jgi:hypothetical protein